MAKDNEVYSSQASADRLVLELSKPCLQPYLHQGPWTVDHGPGLLRAFLNQIWT